MSIQVLAAVLGKQPEGGSNPWTAAPVWETPKEAPVSWLSPAIVVIWGVNQEMEDSLPHLCISNSKDSYHLPALARHAWNTKCGMVAARGWEEGTWGVRMGGCGVAVVGDEL